MKTTNKTIEQFFIGVYDVKHEVPSAEFEVLGVYNDLKTVEDIRYKYRNDSKFKNLVRANITSYVYLEVVELEVERDNEGDVIDFDILKHVGMFYWRPKDAANDYILMQSPKLFPEVREDDDNVLKIHIAIDQVRPGFKRTTSIALQ